MSDEALIWGCCNQDSDGSEYLQCSICEKAYHLDCLCSSVTEESGWVCPACTPKSNKKDHTPCNWKNVSKRPPKRTAPGSPVFTTDSPITKDSVEKIVHNMLQNRTEPQTDRNEVRDIVQDVIQREIGGLASKLSKDMSAIFSSELKSIKEEIKDVKHSMNFISEQYEEFMREHKAAKATIKELQEQNLSLRSSLDNLNNRMNLMEQHNRSNNIEIQCVPEKNNENLLNIVSNLCTVVGSNVTVEHVVNVTRIAKLNTATSRPRSIIVQFNTPKIRDSLLADVIKFNKSNHDNKLNSVHIGFEGQKSPIFVTEHLSPFNKSLHAAARMKAKDKCYKFVWIRNGKIYMRKDENSEKKYIRDMETIEKLN